MLTLTRPEMSDNENSFAPNGLVSMDPLPSDAAGRDSDAPVYVDLRVNRIHDGGRCVTVETRDCYRGSALMPTAWIRPRVMRRAVMHGAVYVFEVPADRWIGKRRQLLALQIRRREDGVDSGGPHDVA